MPSFRGAQFFQVNVTITFTGQILVPLLWATDMCKLSIIYHQGMAKKVLPRNTNLILFHNKIFCFTCITK